MLAPGSWYNAPDDPPVDGATPSRSKPGAPSGVKPLGDEPLLGSNFVSQLLASTQPRSEHDARLAYALAVVSAWSYSDKQALSTKIAFYGLPDTAIEGFAVTNHALFVLATAYVIRSRCGRLAIVTFRGTEPINFASWLTDIDVITKTLPASWNAAGVVHRGFLTNFEAVWDDIERGLEQAPPGSSPLEAIYVTGHSLGGAMAVLAGAKLTSTPHAGKLRGIYTYGQPAVGNAEFAHWAKGIGLHEILFRHVYDRDLVPRLPPQSTHKFVHFGTEYRSKRVPGDGPSTEEPQELWSKAKWWRKTQLVRFVLPSATAAALEFATRRTKWFRWIPFPCSIDDHSPAFYLKTSRDHAHAEAKASASS